MEGNKNKGQQQPLIKKGPCKLHCYVPLAAFLTLFLSCQPHCTILVVLLVLYSYQQGYACSTRPVVYFVPWKDMIILAAFFSVSDVCTVRIRSYASLRQHEQQHVAASLRGPRGPGLLIHQRQLLLRPETQGTCDLTQMQQAVRPSAAFCSVAGRSSTSGVNSVVKFMPNVSVKPEAAEATKTGIPCATVSSGLGVDALLLRSLHSRQTFQQVSVLAQHRPNCTWRLDC